MNYQKLSRRAYIIKTTCSYKKDRLQIKSLLSQQSKQKRNKIKIGIFTAICRFSNHTLTSKPPDQLQSTEEECLLTGYITYLKGINFREN